MITGPESFNAQMAARAVQPLTIQQNGEHRMGISFVMRSGVCVFSPYSMLTWVRFEYPSKLAFYFGGRVVTVKGKGLEELYAKVQTCELVQVAESEQPANRKKEVVIESISIGEESVEAPAFP